MQSHPGLSLSVKSTHHWRIPGIAADAALAAVGPPLATEPPAVQLVVVVVGRSVEAVPDAWEKESKEGPRILTSLWATVSSWKAERVTERATHFDALHHLPNWTIARVVQRLL